MFAIKGSSNITYSRWVKVDKGVSKELLDTLIFSNLDHSQLAATKVFNC